MFSIIGKTGFLTRLGVLLIALNTATPSQAQPALRGGCLSGQTLNGVIEGDLGAEPAGPFTSLLCMEVRNDTTDERFEIAYSSVPLPAAANLTDTDDLVVIGPGGRHTAAQFDVISRWGGTVDNNSLPIRWLQVSLPARVLAGSSNGYELRRYSTAPVTVDPFAVSTNQNGNLWTVDTGLAEFRFDETNPRLFDRIRIDPDNDGSNLVSILSDSPESGPRLVYSVNNQPIQIGGAVMAGGNDIFSDSFEDAVPAPTLQGQLVIDANGVEVIETGPVKATFAMRGHFVADDGSSLCTVATTAPYERFGYSVMATVYRASRDVDLHFEFRNECSDAFTGPWTDDTIEVEQVSWVMNFDDPATSLLYSTDTVSGQTASVSETTRVDQHRGSGAPPNWQRRATVSEAGINQDARTFYEDSSLALETTGYLASVQMPWMKYREPQALSAQSSMLFAEFVSSNLVMGEGKGIWNLARFSLVPTGLFSGTAAETLNMNRRRGSLALQRGLLVRAQTADLNSALLMPGLGNDSASTIKSNYLAWLNLLHDETVLPGGQWSRNKNYGSQYWPDTGSNDAFGIDVDWPNDSSSGMNYWDPAGIESLEFLRSGDPKWAWDLAIPAYWTQAHAAYLNIGSSSHGNRAGVAVQSGGPGCVLVFDPDIMEFVPSVCTSDGSGGGQWHRSGLGSDDYTYAMSMELGYVLRPNLAFRDRLRQAGRMVVSRYDPAIPEANREQAVNAFNNTRQVVQHLEMLANCAEFVPGPDGLACHDRLQSIVSELARDNLPSAMICQGFPGLVTGMANDDIPGPPSGLPTRCVTPQQFMVNALMYQFYYRYWRNYGDPLGGSVQRMLIEYPQQLFTWSVARLPNGDIDTGGNWAAALDCMLDAGGTNVISCVASPDSDGSVILPGYNKAHTAALLLISDELDSSMGLCQRVRAAYDDNDLSGAPTDFNARWNDVGHFNQAGWWKGSSQMLQGMVFGVGLYDSCAP